MTVAEPHARRPPRPVLAVRVGVTGSRRLDALPDDARAAIRHRIAEVLDAVREEVAAVAASAEARRVYGTGPDGSVTTWLRILSPLADGADRMVAEVATERGFRLEVALPFPRGDYARDFSPGSRAAFDRRIDHPEPPPVLALDGGRGDDQDRSYEAVGHLVVRNCDLLIAVWDGTPAKGPGGTADIVRFSARIGPPVWWIDAAGA